MNIASNKRARHDYEILERFTAGIKLFGFEVKAVKAGKTSLRAAFVVPRPNEAILLNAVISPYQPMNTPKGYVPERERRLLLKKREIEHLWVTRQEGLTIIPLRFFIKNNLIKVEIAVARSLKKFEKRRKLIEKATKRDVERELRGKEEVDQRK